MSAACQRSVCAAAATASFARQCNKAEDCVHAMNDPDLVARGLDKAAQQTVSIVELALARHRKADVVAPLGFLTLKLTVDRDLEVFVGKGPPSGELTPPQIEVHEVADRVRDRRKIASGPRLLEQ
jgi:hypothetical protein